MSYHRYRIQQPDDDQRQILIALLSEIGFDSFEERESELDAYINEADNSPQAFQALIQEHEAFKELVYVAEPMPEKNWNEIWESQFQPIRIGNRLGVRASFHPALGTEKEIIIDPKMSFGTGHHATTYMMLEQMLDMDFKGKKVLDYGCGTSILAIAAEMLGAEDVLAIDNDPLCIENSEECLRLNHCTQIRLALADVHQAGNEKVDIVLANINRNTILAQSGVIDSMCQSGAYLLMSGFLVADEEHMQKMAEDLGWKPIKRREQNNWLCLSFQKGSKN